MKEAEILERIESDRAKQRQLSALKQGDQIPVPVNLPERERGDSRDIVAEKIGMSGRTYEKAITLHS